LNITYLHLANINHIEWSHVTTHFKKRGKDMQGSQARKGVQGIQNSEACHIAEKEMKVEMEVLEWWS
jgi:hypothetical protein